MTLLLMLMLVGGEHTAFFQGSLDEALKLSAETGKPVMVDVYTDWCGPCKLLDRTTFKDADVQALFRDKVIAVKVNAEKGNGVQIARKYRIRAYPSMLLLDKDGTELSRLMGYADARDFQAWLNNLPATR